MNEVRDEAIRGIVHQFFRNPPPLDVDALIETIIEAVERSDHEQHAADLDFASQLITQAKRLDAERGV